MAPRALLLLIALAGCKKKAPQAAEAGPEELPDPARTLQLVAVQPPIVDVGQSVRARILGAGFTGGATVSVGPGAALPAVFQDSNSLAVQLPALAIGSYDVAVTNPDGDTARLRAGLTVRGQQTLDVGCGGAIVYFALDQAGLTPEARRTLDANLSCWATSDRPITVEGHADERGTTDYNVALGQRRADAVLRVLVQAGVPASRVRLVSYGEERPADPGHDEPSWSHNRRAEVVVR